MSDQTDTWYRCTIDRKALKALMRRSDRAGLVHVGGYFAALIASGVWAGTAYGTWWALPAFALYGFVWSFANSVVHEACHGTPFRSRWLNELVLVVSGFMVQMEPISVRWVHARHHSYTSFRQQDSELILPNPMTWSEFWVNLIGLRGAWHYWVELLLLSAGIARGYVRESVPPQDMRRVAWNARAFVAIYLGIVIWALATASWWPIFMFILPRVIGGPIYGLMRITQHGGLAMDVQDHRLTTRTMTLNPVLQFFYFNMNYHVEHHMFPMVPFHALPRLHKAIGDQLPAPDRGLLGAYRQILATLRAQQRQPGRYIERDLPSPV